MKQQKFIAVLAMGWCLLSSGAWGDTITNMPRTRLGLFEAQTGRVIIEGTAEIGQISGAAGAVSVRCRESLDAAGAGQVLGAVIGLKQGEHKEDTALIDYDELDSVIQGVDYISKVNYTVTSLAAFDAVYTTRDEFRISAHSSHRQPGTILFFLSSHGDNPTRLTLAPNQFAQFLSLLQQAKSRLDSLNKRA